MDSNRINSIALIPLSEAVTTMYPLMQPTLEDLASQIVDTQSTENLSYPSTSRYTSQALLGAINTAPWQGAGGVEKKRLPTTVYTAVGRSVKVSTAYSHSPPIFSHTSSITGIPSLRFSSRVFNSRSPG